MTTSTKRCFIGSWLNENRGRPWTAAAAAYCDHMNICIEDNMDVVILLNCSRTHFCSGAVGWLFTKLFTNNINLKRWKTQKVYVQICWKCTF